MTIGFGQRMRVLPVRLRGLATVVGLVCVAALNPIAQSLAQEKSYWLRQGGAIVGSCPGKNDGEPLKAANGDGGWLLITGVINCRDAGDRYSFEVKFLSVSVNPSARSRIPREVLNFDWIGLAVYAPKDGGARVDWLYDEALPIRGTLSRSSTDKIYFGNLKFDVPKADIAKAANFLFYMTSQGPIYNFGLL
jgi:hypothetical protein